MVSKLLWPLTTIIWDMSGSSWRSDLSVKLCWVIKCCDLQSQLTVTAWSRKCKFNSYLLWPSTTMKLAGLMAANNLMWVLPPPYHVQCPSLMILVLWESKLFLSKVLVFRCVKYKTWTSRGLDTMKKMASQCLGALKELASWGLDAIK